MSVCCTLILIFLVIIHFVFHKSKIKINKGAKDQIVTNTVSITVLHLIRKEEKNDNINFLIIWKGEIS